jgi:hypothetical protein
MSATKNVGAQRDRLLQLRRRLQQPCPEDEVQEEVASGLRKVYSKGLDYGARYLADCLETAAENRDSFTLSSSTAGKTARVQVRSAHLLFFCELKGFID